MSLSASPLEGQQGPHAERAVRVVGEDAIIHYRYREVVRRDG